MAETTRGRFRITALAQGESTDISLQESTQNHMIDASISQGSSHGHPGDVHPSDVSHPRPAVLPPAPLRLADDRSHQQPESRSSVQPQEESVPISALNLFQDTVNTKVTDIVVQ